MRPDGLVHLDALVRRPPEAIRFVLERSAKFGQPRFQLMEHPLHGIWVRAVSRHTVTTQERLLAMPIHICLEQSPPADGGQPYSEVWCGCGQRRCPGPSTSEGAAARGWPPA